MGLLRSFGKFFGGLIFTTFLALSIFSLGLAEFTEYKNLKPLATDVIKTEFLGMLTENQLNQIYSLLLYQCTQQESVEFPVLESLNITIKCKDVEEAGQKNFTTMIAENLFDNIYHKEYDCEFIQCLQQPGLEKFLVLLSSKANSFFKNSQVILFSITGFGLAILVLSVETWGRRIKYIGTSLLFTGLPFLVLKYLKNFIQLPEMFIPMVNQLLTPFIRNFTIIFFIGIVLIIFGFLLEFYIKKQKT